MTFVAIDGLLLQRASTVTMSVSVSQQPLPRGFSGVSIIRFTDINLLIPPFADVLQKNVSRTAIAASNSSTQQDVTAIYTVSQTVYLSYRSYLAGAMLVMIINIGVIVPLFLGWWQLGRTVSLSTVEAPDTEWR